MAGQSGRGSSYKGRYRLLPMACIPCSVFPGVRKTNWKATSRISSFARLFLVLQGSIALV